MRAIAETAPDGSEVAAQNLPPCVIRADAGPDIGGGHLMRCLALAEAWRQAGGEVIVASGCNSPELQQRIRSAATEFVPVQRIHPAADDLETTRGVLRDLETRRSGPAWLVLDGYQFDESYQRAIRETAARLLVVDDDARHAKYDADVIVNQNLGSETLRYRCNRPAPLLLGPRYALLRSEFTNRHDSSPKPVAARRVLVTAGASDSARLSETLVTALAGVGDLEVTLVVGPAATFSPQSEVRGLPALCAVRNPSRMEPLMARADVAVGAAGSTAWELACMGVPSVLVSVAPNQQCIGRALAAAGVAHYLGDVAEVEPHRITAAVRELIADDETRSTMSRLGRLLVDGKGATRVAEILAFFEPALDLAEARLRAADEADRLLIWQWANDPEVRARSFHPEPIPWGGHVSWYDNRLRSALSRIWILEWRRIPLGQIRCDALDDTAKISFIVAPGWRGRGIGTRLLREASARTAEIGVRRLRGTTFADNEASRHAFVKAGFAAVGERVIQGHRSIIFERPCRER